MNSHGGHDLTIKDHPTKAKTWIVDCNDCTHNRTVRFERGDAERAVSSHAALTEAEARQARMDARKR